MNRQGRKDLVIYRITRAKDTLKEVEILIENKLWSTVINRLYYACFYAVSGLLIQREIKSETHKGTRMMFGFHVVKEGLINRDFGKFYTDLFNKRHSSDYDDFIQISEEEALSYFEPAKELILKIEELVNDYYK
jgi:uncharacterized protein (UPF0332 family)